MDSEILAAITVTGLSLLVAAGAGFEIARRVLERADAALDIDLDPFDA